MSALVAVVGAVHQDDLVQARQMQALSLAVHIPLVCFGISFPALVLFLESLYLRTGDPVYRTLAMRWSKIMITLFAVGVVTGTILSFEFGLLWPQFMASFGNVFGLGFAFEGFSFFLEAIFIAIYVYAWDRISARKHLACGVIVVITGLTGSLMVIAVNGWMNHPSGFRLVNGRAVDVHPWSALFGNAYFWHELVHMYLAGYIVTGFVLAAAYSWGALRGRFGRYEKTALTVALAAACVAAPMQLIVGDWVARDVTQKQPAKLAAIEGLYGTTDRAPIHILGWYDGRKVQLRDRDPGPAVVPREAQPERDRAGPRRRAARRPAAELRGERDALRLPDDGRHRHRARAPRRASTATSGSGSGACPSRRGSTVPSCSRARPRWWR